MGESASRRRSELAAVRAAIEMRYRLVDTAEMYGEGGAEQVVGSAVAECMRVGTVGFDPSLGREQLRPRRHSTAFRFR